MEWKDVGVLEIRGDLDLLEKTLRAEDGGELGAQHLHRHLAVVLQVLSEVDGGYAAGADLPLDGIAVGKGGGETVEKVGHCVLALLATVLEYGFTGYRARFSGAPCRFSFLIEPLAPFQPLCLPSVTRVIPVSSCVYA